MRRIIYNVYPDWPDEEIQKTVKMAPEVAIREPGPVILRYAEGEYDLGGGVRLIAGPGGCEVTYQCYGAGKLSESWNGSPGAEQGRPVPRRSQGS